MMLLNQESLPFQLPQEHINLTEFREESTLGDGVPLMLQLKGFNRQDRIARRETEITSGVSGGNQDRPVTQGKIALFNNLAGISELSFDNALFTEDLPDPRGMCAGGGDLFVGAVDEVRHIDLVNHTETSVKNPWFAFIHSVVLSADQKRLLVTSPGFDRILEVDAATGATNWEWVAWDHGFSTTVSSKKKIVSHATPDTDLANTLVVSSPDSFKGGLGLPPGDRAAFPNSAMYLDEEHIVASMFHAGLVVIDKKTGHCTSVLENLSHPHGIRRYKSGFVITNTGSGSCLLLDENLKPQSEIHFQDLPSTQEPGNVREWLQQVIPVNDELLMAIDSRRACIFVINPESKLIRRIAYPQNWVMQEVCPVNEAMVRYFSANQDDQRE